VKNLIALFVLVLIQVAQAASITKTALNFRTGPGTEFPIIRTLEAGRTVEVINDVDPDNNWDTPNWSQVLYGEELGYVSSEYLTNKSDWLFNASYTSKENYYPGETRIALEVNPKLADQPILVRVFLLPQAYFQELNYKKLEFSAPPTRGNRRYVSQKSVPSDRIYDFNQRKTFDFVELNDLKPGGYIITYSRPETPNAIESHSTILVTRLAAFIKSDTDHSEAWVVDAKTGKPLNGVLVEWLDESPNGESKKVASANTNSSGIASAITPDQARRSFKASLGDDVAFVRDAYGGGVNENLQSGTAPARIGYREDQRALIVTDRPLYRGGDTVQVEGTVNDLNGPSFKPSTKPLLLKLTQLEKNDVVQEEFKVMPDASGHFKFQFKLEAELRDSMALSAFDALTGRPAGWASFAVRPYIKPLFSAKLEGASEVVAGTQQFDLKGTYFAGGKINALATVYLGDGYPAYSGRTYRNEDREQTYFKEDQYRQSLPSGAYSWEGAGDDRQDQGKPTKITKGNGQITFDLKTKNNQPTDYNLEARVRDELGREVIAEHSVRVYPSNIALKVETDNDNLAANQKMKVTVQTRKVGSTEMWANQAVAVKLFRHLWVFENKRWVSKVLQAESFKNKTNAKGEVNLEYTPKGAGSVWVEINATDNSGRETSLNDWLAYVPEETQPVTQESNQLYLELSFRDRVHTVGEELPLKVKTNLPDSTNVLFSIEGRKLFSSQVTTIGTLRKYKLKVTEELIPGFMVRAIAIQDQLDVYASQLKQYVPPTAKKIDVRLAIKHVVNKPGDEVEVTVKTTLNGQPISSWVLLGAVNKIIYQLQDQTTPDPYLYFWGYGGNKVVSYDSITQSVCECGGGGGDGGGEPAAFRENFNDTALFKSVTTAADGTASLKIKLPDDLVSYQLNAWALSKDAAAGFTERTLEARLPFYVRLNLPAFLTKGDQSAGYATVHNLTNKALQTQVVLEADKQIKKDVLVPALDSLEIPFAFNATRVGEMKVSASAKSKLFSDAIRLSIPVREVGNQVELVWQAESAGGTLTDAIEIPSEARSTTLQTTVAPSNLGMALGDINALKKLEFSQLYEALLTHYWIYRLERSLGYPAEESLKTLQKKAGLLLAARSYRRWVYPSGKDDLYGTILNIDTLLKVRDVLPNEPINSAIEGAIQFLRSKITEKDRSSVYIQAQADRLEALWKNSEALQKEQKPVNLEEIAYLLQSNPARFSTWYAFLLQKQTQSSTGVSIANNLEATAYTLIYQASQGLAEATSSAKWLSNVLLGSSYRSVAQSALAKFALANYLKSKGLTTENRNLSVSLLDQQNMLTSVPLVGTLLNWLLPKEKAFDMTYSSTQPFAAKRVLSYFTSEKPLVPNKNLKVSRNYSLTKLQRNRLLEVRLTIELNADQKMLKITDPFPGGFETFGTISYGSLWSEESSAWADAKTLSDKVVFTFSNVPKGKFVLSYKLRSLAPGKYFAASPTLESEASQGKVEGSSAQLEVVE
jgi:alpha-2-macroglobulin